MHVVWVRFGSLPSLEWESGSFSGSKLVAENLQSLRSFCFYSAKPSMSQQTRILPLLFTEESCWIVSCTKLFRPIPCTQTSPRGTYWLAGHALAIFLCYQVTIKAWHLLWLAPSVWFSLFKIISLKLRYGSVVSHYFKIHLLSDFLHLLHLKMRIFWTSPSWSLLETSFNRSVWSVVFPSHWVLSVLNVN